MAWQILKTAVDQWFEHGSARLGAALAYYSVFSMGPLLLIVTSVAGLFFGADFVRRGLSSQFKALLGETGSKAIEAMLEGASSPHSGRLAALAGIALLVVAALGVVSQLKDAINTIWNVEEPKDVSVRWYVRTYLVSFAGILGLGFLLAVSLVISTGLAALSSQFTAGMTVVGILLNTAISLLLLTLLFAMLFKWFPDTHVEWRDVLPGAAATAVLFNLGEFVIGWYIGTQGLESTYGAAASIVVLLVWVYYSAQIVLFGAELTHAYATTSAHCAEKPLAPFFLTQRTAERIRYLRWFRKSAGPARLTGRHESGTPWYDEPAALTFRFMVAVCRPGSQSVWRRSVPSSARRLCITMGVTNS